MKKEIKWLKPSEAEEEKVQKDALAAAIAAMDGLADDDDYRTFVSKVLAGFKAVHAVKHLANEAFKKKHETKTTMCHNVTVDTHWVVASALWAVTEWGPFGRRDVAPYSNIGVKMCRFAAFCVMFDQAQEVARKLSEWEESEYFMSSDYGDQVIERLFEEESKND